MVEFFSHFYTDLEVQEDKSFVSIDLVEAKQEESKVDESNEEQKN